MHPSHAGAHPASLDTLLTVLAAAAVLAYVVGAVSAHRRGRPWPWWRTAAWCAGVAAGLAAVAGPLAVAAHTSFVGHSAAHLIGGMVAPLLLALAAPITLALRTLATTPARRLSRLLRSRAVRVLAHPVTAGFLVAGGLWVLYRTPLIAAMQASPLVHAAVHAHLLVAGFVFVTGALRLAPMAHPPDRVLTAVVLVLTMASHGVLMKTVYAAPLAGFTAADVRAGAQLMYYAGAWIEAAVVVLFCAQWYRAAGRRRAAFA